MTAEPFVGVLIEMRAVERTRPCGVFGKVRGHPVEEHAETRVVAGAHEGAEVVGRAVAARRREQAERLIAPRAVERVLHDRHQLDMGEPHVLGVGHELVGQLAIGEDAVSVLAPP